MSLPLNEQTVLVTGAGRGLGGSEGGQPRFCRANSQLTSLSSTAAT